MNKQDILDVAFLEDATRAAGRSRDPSTKVGCIIVDDLNRVVSTGYNGFPRGVKDDERLNNRDIKYKIILHAEENAVLNAERSVRGFTAYASVSPCAKCTAILIQVGIKRIVTKTPSKDIAVRYKESFDLAKDIMKEAGVEFVVIDEH